MVGLEYIRMQILEVTSESKITTNRKEMIYVEIEVSGDSVGSIWFCVECLSLQSIWQNGNLTK